MREFGKMLRSIAVSLLIIAAAVKIFGNMSADELTQGGLAVGAILLAVIYIMAATRLIGRASTSNTTNAKAETAIRDFGKMILNISISLLLIAAAMKIFAAMPVGEITKGGVVVAIILGAMVGIMAATRLIASNEVQAGAIKSMGKMMLSISAGLLIAALAMKLAGNMDTSEIVKGGTAIVILLGAMVGVMAATKLLSNNETSLKSLKNVGLMMLMLSGAVLVLTGAMYVLTKLDPKRYSTALSTIVVMLGAFAGLMFATKFIPQDGMKTLIGVIIAIAVLVGAMIGLSYIDPERLKNTAMSIAGVLAALGGMMIGLGILTKFNRGITGADIAKTFVMFMAILGPIALIVSMMALMPQAYDATDDAVAISVLLLAMTGVIAAMNMFKPDAKNILKGVGALLALTAVVAAAAGIMILLNEVDPDNTLDKVLGLSAMLLAMSVTLGIVSLVGKLNLKAISTGVLGLAMMAGVVALVVLVCAQMDAMNVEPSVKNSMAITVLLLAMAGVLAIVSVIGLIPPHSILLGIAGLALMVVVLELLVLALATMKALDINPSIEQCSALCILLIGMSAALAILGGVGTLGPAAFIGIGALAALIGALTAIVAAAGGLMKIPGIQEFMAGGIEFFKQLFTGIGEIIGNFIGGIASGVTDALPAIADNLASFAAKMEGIKPETMQGVKCLAEAILILTAAEMLDGIMRFFSGGKGAFQHLKEELPALGTAFADFKNNLGDFTEEDAKKAGYAAEAIKYLAEAAAAIPNSGGWLGKIMGENDVGTFGAQLPELATNLCGFVTNLGDFTDTQADKAEAAADVILALAEAAEAIPNSGGWWAKITGDNSISEFGGQLPALGTNIAGFITGLGTFTDAQTKTAECAADALVALAGAADKMPTTGGWWAKIVGDQQSLKDFGGQLPSVAEALKGFVDGLGSFSDDQVATVGAGVDAINAFAGLAQIDMKGLTKNLPDFSKKIISFATNLKTFINEMFSLDPAVIASSTDNMTNIINLLKKFEEVNFDKVQAFGKSLKSVADAGVSAFIEKIKNSYDDVNTVGKQMIDQFIGGASSKTTDVENAAAALRDSALGQMTNEDVTAKWQGAGVACVDGFIAGIESQVEAAAQAAAIMAAAAAKAAEAELDINSPSKVFRKIGTSVPEGFVQGIDKLGGVVAASSEAMGDTAIDGVRNSLSNLGRAVTSDIDTQPVIRPVLDLSEVRTGIHAIDGMFGTGASVGVMANVRSVGYSMDRRNQNGGNGDVVKAIGQLHDDIGNISQPSYTIGNITLSGDDEVAAAFETIIRAARIERRT
jgi:hypothetical protein